MRRNYILLFEKDPMIGLHQENTTDTPKTEFSQSCGVNKLFTLIKLK